MHDSTCIAEIAIVVQVQFLSASEEINKRPDEYWSLVMDIAKTNTVTRIKRCCTIMGRKESEELSAAQIMYPCMQCADIFFLKVRLHTRQRFFPGLAYKYAYLEGTCTAF